ncbi:MAG: MFS transporter [Verrucomicrobiales bacterium]|nr:MFS transporter [Verrucomicrobiales bacterium]MBP9225110.1 MFS transporter [Verrucomicrobiales bacterium]HQZ26706.1 MFS transporter [Verrucomicrobiales bacterium]
MGRSKNITILVLLVIAVGINYIDRGTLSVSASNISAEFQLDNTQMGLLFSAFFWSYALFQLVAGWLVDRYDVKWVFAIGFLVWSLSTAAMGFASGLTVFFLLRLTLGMGESVAYPATSRILAANYPEERRGFANALIDAGSKIGPALSTLLGGLMVAHYGWRSLFLVVGLGSLFWLIPWLWLVPSEKRKSGMWKSGIANTIEEPRTVGVEWRQLMVRREVWGTSLGMFCLGYVWYFLVSWLPAYLEAERGFTKEAMAIFGSLPFWAMAVTSLAGGWFSDRWIRSGATPTRVRKTFIVAGFLLCAAFMIPAVMVNDAKLCVAFLTAACAALGFYTSNVWAVTQTLAGPSAAGKWTGVQNCIGNLGGVVSPALTGWLVTQTGSFTLAFVFSSAVLVLGVAAYIFLVGRVVPLEWPDRLSANPADS